jgi:hypothetical protein
MYSDHNNWDKSGVQYINESQCMVISDRGTVIPKKSCIVNFLLKNTRYDFSQAFSEKPMPGRNLFSASFQS